jgi:uncharacterized protein
MSTNILSEHFIGPDLDPRLKWHCPPARWSIRASCLIMQPDAKTDFWQRTHYGFSADNGHLLYSEVAGDFALTTRVRFAPVHQYDQAGLMVRCSPDCWIKTSVEFEPGGPSRLGAVITRAGFSDWSTQDFPTEWDTIELRVELRGQDVLVEYRQPDALDSPAERTLWTQIRLGHLPIFGGSPVQAGVYACSPKAAGFSAEFDFLAIERF